MRSLPAQFEADTLQVDCGRLRNLLADPAAASEADHRHLGEATRSLEPSPWLSMKKFTMPLGISGTSAQQLARSAAVCAAWPGSLTTDAQPDAIAGASARMVRYPGEFHGIMSPATPAGRRMHIDCLPGV